MVDYVTAQEIAADFGLPEKQFRRALRDAKLAWHVHNQRWTVPIGDARHDDMLRVARALAKRR